MFSQSCNWGEGCKLGAAAAPAFRSPASRPASSLRQPKVSPSLQNPSALRAEGAGGEACIDHSDKHLTLQEHTLPLLKLLIALNIFSYCGWLATNCSPVGRGCPPQWGPLTLRSCRRPRGGWARPPEGHACQPGLVRGTDCGGGGASHRAGAGAPWSCRFLWAALPPRGRVFPVGSP